jgi:hypothetical protein
MNFHFIFSQQQQQGQQQPQREHKTHTLFDIYLLIILVNCVNFFPKKEATTLRIKEGGVVIDSQEGYLFCLFLNSWTTQKHPYLIPELECLSRHE